MGFEGLISSNSSNSGGGGARVVADSSSKNHFMHSVSIVESPLFSPPITISKQNFSTMFLSTQRKMEGHDQMALIGENFENGLMGRMRDDENESRSGSDNFEGGSGDDQDAGDNTPQRKKKYHRHTPQQIQELESFFKDCPHPDEKQRSDLGKKLGLENKQIKFWFQNRRTQMKTQLERHENMILKQENDKLRAENTMMREAIENPICNNCGGHAIPGRISMSGIRPPMGLIGNRVQIDPSMLVNLAASAMDELIGMTQIDNSLWIKSSDGGKEVLNHEEYARMSSIYNGTKPIGYATEATRETGLVLINSLALVDSLMDAITWIDHSQYDESVIPQLYRRLVSSGIGFGAQRWIATLQRQCQCLAILSSPSIRAENPKALVGQPGMKSLLKLTQRMTECFYSGICASSTRKWEIIPLATLGDDIKVMTRKNVWMPVSRQRLFDFLREARTRRHWDDLASDVTVNEIHSIVKGEGQGNCISILRANRAGASVNMKLFRDYATTASVREGDLKVLEVLINNGASQIACEEALMESSHFGRPRFAELLMQSDMIRPEVAVHALVSACCRGFVEVVDVLIKHGVDANAIDRTLLQSSKPFLYANVDCNALFAAVVSRQINVVRLLLQVGVRRDIKVKLGAWSWETDTGEESRVGVGLAEAYPITWCAVEYFESTGSILKMLLCPCSLNSWHIGRTLLHHAIVCDNEKAVTILLNSGEFTELAVQTTEETNVHPIHMAARFGSCNILKSLINAGCNLDSQTKSGDTALMICIRHKHEECLRVLASAGADLGLVNSFGQCATSIANSLQWTEVFHKVILDVIRARKVVKSSNASRFSALLFVTQANNIKGLKRLIENKNLDIDEQNGNGFSAAMIAVADGSVEAFKLLLYAGADVAKLKNKNGLTALDLIEMNPNEEVFHKVIIKYALKKGRNASIEMKPLHIAARYGDIDSAHKLLNEGYDVNALDGHGYTPLMLAARGCHVDMCKLLLSHDAKCYIENEKHETALSLARENGRGNDAERVIMDEQARRLVLYGANVMKHTKCGKGSPHSKVLVMVEDAGILKWGKSNKRKVVCKEAVVGTSKSFRWNRRKKFDVDDPGMFHVITTEGKQVHFVCEGGIEMAEMWVRGIRLVTTEAIFGRKR